MSIVKKYVAHMVDFQAKNKVTQIVVGLVFFGFFMPLLHTLNVSYFSVKHIEEIHEMDEFSDVTLSTHCSDLWHHHVCSLDGVVVHSTEVPTFDLLKANFHLSVQINVIYPIHKNSFSFDYASRAPPTSIS